MNVTELDRDHLRSLAEWTSNGPPVSSLYLDVDGRRFPRRQDVELRAHELSRRLLDGADELGREARRSIEADRERMLAFFADLDRGPTRGVALFSCAGEGRWDEVRVSRPLRDRAVVGDRPHVMPLEALLETYACFCTVIVDREKARLFLSRVGRVTEQTDLFDDVPGRHDQGGWSQARFQRHVDDHVGRHLKHVGEALLDFWKRRRFDHLILAGPEEALVDFERALHDYLRQRVVARVSLAITATADEVLERSLVVEEELEERKERETIDHLVAEASAGRRAVLGLRGVLGALNDGRVDTLVVPFGLESSGMRCSACGRLAERGRRCATCGGDLEDLSDVVDAAVASALQQRARVETISFAGTDALDGERVGALLRY